MPSLRLFSSEGAHPAAVSLLAVAAFFACAKAGAQSFYGTGSAGAQRSFNYTLRPATRTYTEVVYYDARPISVAPRPVQPEPEKQESAPAPRIESSGSQPTVAGNRAIVKRGVAYAPANAPLSVKRAIWAVNSIRNKPYKWGGGHGSFYDNGYDCSGSVSFALHHAGVLGSPIPSREFQSYGQRGKGRWVTVYARNGHTFANIAGLRLDTTDFIRGGDVGPRWYSDGRDTWGFSARHPVGL